jgi:hypothetical protein
MAQAPLLDGLEPNNRLGALFQWEPHGGAGEFSGSNLSEAWSR